MARKSRVKKTRMYREMEILCAKKNMTISDLASRTGIPRATFAWWRNNEPLSIERYRQILNVLGVEITEVEDDNA